MKKLLAASCAILCLHSISQVPQNNESVEEKTAGQKLLVKAISVIVNTEANKKAPAKNISLPASECP